MRTINTQPPWKVGETRRANFAAALRTGDRLLVPVLRCCGVWCVAHVVNDDNTLDTSRVVVSHMPTGLAIPHITAVPTADIERASTLMRELAYRTGARTKSGIRNMRAPIAAIVQPYCPAGWTVQT